MRDNFIGENGTKMEKKAVAAVDTAGGFFSWQNPEGRAIAVTRLVLDITTASTGACTVDCGATATSATTLSDTLIDGASVATIALLDNITDGGTNGKARQKVAAGKWVTGSVASGASAGVVGSVYIHYHIL